MTLVQAWGLTMASWQGQMGGEPDAREGPGSATAL